MAERLKGWNRKTQAPLARLLNRKWDLQLLRMTKSLRNRRNLTLKSKRFIFRIKFTHTLNKLEVQASKFQMNISILAHFLLLRIKDLCLMTLKTFKFKLLNSTMPFHKLLKGSQINKIIMSN